MVNLSVIYDHVMSMLKAGLSEKLTYHNIFHTLDVNTHCLAIAKEEGIEDEQVLLNLQIAALYHDVGFIYIYHDHEEKGCEIAREQLPGFGINETAIEEICGLIMATKVPQSPKTHLEEIICDADLDYLGREDFFERAEKLRLELLEYKFISDNHDWEEMQLEFLLSHDYFTSSSRKKRSPAKKEFIKQLAERQDKVKR